MSAEKRLIEMKPGVLVLAFAGLIPNYAMAQQIGATMDASGHTVFVLCDDGSCLGPTKKTIVGEIVETAANESDEREVEITSPVAATNKVDDLVVQVSTSLPTPSDTRSIVSEPHESPVQKAAVLDDVDRLNLDQMTADGRAKFIRALGIKQESAPKPIAAPVVIDVEDDSLDESIEADSVPSIVIGTSVDRLIPAPVASSNQGLIFDWTEDSVVHGLVQEQTAFYTSAFSEGKVQLVGHFRTESLAYECEAAVLALAGRLKALPGLTRALDVSTACERSEEQAHGSILAFAGRGDV